MRMKNGSMKQGRGPGGSRNKGVPGGRVNFNGIAGQVRRGEWIPCYRNPYISSAGYHFSGSGNQEAEKQTLFKEQCFMRRRMFPDCPGRDADEAMGSASRKRVYHGMQDEPLRTRCKDSKKCMVDGFCLNCLDDVKKQERL